MLSNTHPNDLLSILSSGKTEKEIKKNLLETIKKKPDLINSTYTLNRSLFHLLVLYQFPKIMNSLLQNEHALPMAHAKDRKGQTILHYAVRSNTYNKKMLPLIVEKLPKLMNVTDENSRTPLDMAIQEKNTDAQKLLTKLSSLIEDKTQDTNGEHDNGSRYQSETDQHFSTQYPLLGKREKSPPSVKKLSKEFTMLKLSPHASSQIEPLPLHVPSQANIGDEALSLFTTRSMPETPIRMPLPLRRKGTSLSDAHDPLAIIQAKIVPALQKRDIKLDDLINGNHKKLNAYLSFGGDPNEKIFLGNSGKSLIELAFICATDNLRNKDIDRNLQQQFFILLPKAFLPSDPSFIAFVRERKDSLVILQTSIKKLRERLFSEQQKHENRFNILSRKLEKTLYHSGLGQMKPESLMPKDYALIHKVLGLDLHLVEYLDQICACMQDSNDIEPIFSKELVLSYTLGLCSFITPKSLVESLSFLIKYFNFSQKLTACLIIKELIEWDVHHELMNDSFCLSVENFTLSLKKHTKGNSIPKIAEELLELLLEKKQFANNVVVKNYTCLQQYLVSHIELNNLPDIQPKISSAIQNKAVDKKETANLLANELRLFSFLFYQNFKIKELYNEAWKRDNKEIIAPNIILQMQYYNHCTNWIADAILEHPVEEIPLAMSFFIETAQLLGQITEGMGPDLNGHMNVMGAFNKGPISRLQSMIKSSSPQIENLFKEMSELSSAAHNYKWQREFFSHIPTSIPFFGIYTKDIISANENKGLPLLYTLGKIFRSILLIQKDIKFEPVIFKSNLIHKLTSHHQLGDEAIENRQYSASYRALTPANENTLDLNTFTSISDFFEKLDDIIEKQYIPNIIVHNKERYAINTCTFAFIERFHELNKPENKVHKEKMDNYIEKLQHILKQYKNTPIANPLLILHKLRKHSSTQNLSVQIEEKNELPKSKKEKSKRFSTYRKR